MYSILLLILIILLTSALPTWPYRNPRGQSSSFGQQLRSEPFFVVDRGL